ncbi:ATP-binding protein [Vitiosangium sp. GDMCC 1.1324]|uniref:hybrid sensor histidine kinase/response regulator n=1 Tax=Vitiosangium sp. (strain GDMCC 1.1324) TaxID=2138576 RepID=UPI000D3C1DF5|nr:ATP-binding protein [Vitiosangium sp. GDMCC 1.1324]PTL76866.1 sensor protein [Vitiosangium sp. GDMCC 1.1324]
MHSLPDTHGFAPPRLEQLLEVVTDGVLALDVQGRPTYVNTSAERILGRGRDELLGRQLWRELPELEETELGLACQRALAEGVPTTVEEYLAALGAWLEARVFPTGEGLLVLLRDVTELKQVEADYARLHTLVMSAPAVAFVTRGPQHVFELSNPRHRQLLDGRQVLGRTAHEALPEWEDPGVLEALDQVLATGAPRVLEQVPLGMEGSRGGREERLFHLTCQPLRNAAGRVDGVASFAFEVTDLVRARRRAELLAEDLSRSEARFRSLVVATSTILWTTDATGVIHEDSPTWCAFTGQSYEKWRSGTGWMEAIHPDDRARASAVWKRAFASRGLYEVEYRLRRADGTYTPVVSRGVPVLELDGSVREWVGSITDITAQRRARQALELISEASAVLSSTLDLRQALERLTRCLVPRFAAWCGVYLREGEGPIERVAFTDVDPLRALRLRKAGRLLDVPREFRQVMESGRPELFPALTEEALASEPDESRRELRRAFVGLRGLVVPIIVNGRRLGVLLLAVGEGLRAYDADDLRVAEELAHRASITLEHARLFELARQERDRAEEANRAKDDFLATVSHELRTPLTAILGWASILRTSALPPERQARALETVERSARAQAQIVDDLLDISRIVAGRMRLEARPVEMATVVEAALDTVRPAAVARNIRLEPELEFGVGLVQGDAQRLQQVAWNLLTNAIKFTPEGGRVEVQLRRVEAHVELEVADSGQGIPPSFLPHVFERFRQADGSATRRYGGLGLGLAIVRYLVELHGGTVQAHSEGEGRGARFIVRLPLTGTRASEGSSPRTTPSPAEKLLPEHLPDLSGVRVLVVDDEQDTRELLRVVLEERRAHVTTTSSAAEAFESLVREPPDLLVSDIGMPDEDGYALIRRVRALPPERGGRVPATALTAFTRLEDRTRALGAGFQGYVPKPVDPSELVMALANLINRFGAAR